MMPSLAICHPLCRALCAAASGVLVFASIAFAGEPDSQFEFSADRANVKCEVRDVPRREILRRLFDGTNTEVQWFDGGLGNEPISGNFNGPVAAVARQLLRGTNFTMVYDGNARPSRIIVIGASGNAAVVSTIPPAPAMPAPPSAQAPPGRPPNAARGTPTPPPPVAAASAPGRVRVPGR